MVHNHMLQFLLAVVGRAVIKCEALPSAVYDTSLLRSCFCVETFVSASLLVKSVSSAWCPSSVKITIELCVCCRAKLEELAVSAAVNKATEAVKKRFDAT